MKARSASSQVRLLKRLACLGGLAALVGLAPSAGIAQNKVTEDTAEWFTLGGDYAHTRFTPAEEISAENFHELEVVWEWDGASFGGSSGRSTPTYVDGKLFTVSGARRHVVAIDPKSGGDSLVVSTAEYTTLGILNASLLWQRHRVFEH